MGLKLSVAPRAITVDQYRDVVVDAVDMHCSLEALHALHSEITELETIQANVDLCLNALQGANSTSMLKVLDAQESVAALCNVAEEKLSVAIATEGLVDSTKNFFKNLWKKIKEFFAKLCDIFRRVFSNAEGELKHLEKMVASENDKNFNPDAEVSQPIPTKKAIDALIHAAGIAYKAANTVLPHFNKIIADPKIADALKKLGDANLNLTKKEDVIKSDEILKTPELGKFIEETAAEFEKVGAAIQKDVEADPILKNMTEFGDRIIRLGDKNPIAALKIIGNNFIGSGKISELGWKTGADMRGTVTEFTSMWRNVRGTLSQLDSLLTQFNKLTPLFEKIATNSGVPKNFVIIVRNNVDMVRVLLSLITKNEHTALIGVTRIVRACYK